MLGILDEALGMHSATRADLHLDMARGGSTMFLSGHHRALMPRISEWGAYPIRSAALECRRRLMNTTMQIDLRLGAACHAVIRQCNKAVGALADLRFAHAADIVRPYTMGGL